VGNRRTSDGRNGAVGDSKKGRTCRGPRDLGPSGLHPGDLGTIGSPRQADRRPPGFSTASSQTALENAPGEETEDRDLTLGDPRASGYPEPSLINDHARVSPAGPPGPFSRRQGICTLLL
jgi:hypothetical protein